MKEAKGKKEKEQNERSKRTKQKLKKRRTKDKQEKVIEKMLKKEEKKLLKMALKQDLDKGDITSALLEKKKCGARIIAKEDCVLSGVEEAVFLFNERNCGTKVLKKDGKKVNKGTIVMRINGLNRSVLEAERTALNFLGRMSGVATMSNKAKKIAGENCKIALTRKVAPLNLLFDKKSAEHAGIMIHRRNLHYGVLIKENHLAFEGITKLVEKARKKGFRKIEVECENLLEVKEAVNCGAGVVMLDNFSVKNAEQAIKYIRKKGSTQIEISGGINFNNLRRYASLKPDFISLGILTHSVKNVNFSLEIVK